MQDAKDKLLNITAFIIKKYRNNKSISNLCNEIGLSKSIWSELEKGKKDIQFSTFYRIAEALDIKPSVIITEIENNLGNEFTFLE